MSFDLAALRAALVKQRMKQAMAALGSGPLSPAPRGGGYQLPFNGMPEPDFPGPQVETMGAITDLDRRPPMPHPQRRTIGGGDFSPIQRMLESYYAAGAPAPTRYGSDMVGNQGASGYINEPDHTVLADGDMLSALRQRLLGMRRRNRGM